MAKRMASSAEEKQTSSRTNPSRKYLISLRTTLVRLRIRMLRHHDFSFFNGCILAVFLLKERKERFIFARRISDGCTHEICPDRQRCLAACFPGAKRLLLVKANPYAAGDTGREAHKPRISVDVGGPRF